MGHLAPFPAASPPDRPKRVVPTTALVKAALTEFEKEAGGREQLLKVLLGAAPESRFDAIVGLIADPEADTSSLATLCASAGVSVGELLEAYKSGLTMRAQVRAFTHMSATVEAAMVDFLRRCVPHTAPCPDCNGTGRGLPLKKTPTVIPPCETCRGVGTVHVDANLEHQTLLFEYLQLQPPKAAASTTVGVFVPPAPPPGESLATMLKTMDAILHPSRRHEATAEADIVEGETVAPADPVA